MTIRPSYWPVRFLINISKDKGDDNDEDEGEEEEEEEDIHLS